MPLLHVQLFGTLAITNQQGQALPFRSDKVRGLLTFLLVENGKHHTRKSLATMLWSERTTSLI